MNKENLQRMADYIKTIPQELFNMEEYHLERNCKTVGCVIGHCISLENPDNIPRCHGDIAYTLWSENFTGLDRHSDAWRWCFDPKWYGSDNTPLGASKRIEWFLKNGLDRDWQEQMFGILPIKYWL